MADSPCVASCALNVEKICTGCYRHIDEIVDWNKKTHHQQLEIIQNTAARKAAISDGVPQKTTPITQEEWQAAKTRLKHQQPLP